VTVSIEFWLRFEAQIFPTRLALNFLLITARADRKVHLCDKTFDFFRGWILIRLTWNLSRFVPSSVEILTWNFRKKLFPENFFEILCKTRLSNIYQHLWNFALLSAIFILGPYCAEKFHTSTSICCLHPGKRHAHKRITRRRYGEENPGRFVFVNKFCSLLVWDLLRFTLWEFWFETFTRRLSPCLLSFGWN